MGVLGLKSGIINIDTNQVYLSSNYIFIIYVQYIEMSVKLHHKITFRFIQFINSCDHITIYFPLRRFFHITSVCRRDNALSISSKCQETYL